MGSVLSGPSLGVLASATAAVAIGCGVLLQRGVAGTTNRTIGFLHPCAKDGGGGERVLWCAIRAIMRARPQAQVVLFTDLPPHTPGEDLCALLSERARTRFGVELPSRFEVVELSGESVDAAVDPRRWPTCTRLMQAACSVRLGVEALTGGRAPALLIDTAGFPFALPLARLLGCRTAAYVHYPWVRRSSPWEESGRVAHAGGFPFLLRATGKAAYGALLVFLYGAAGWCAQVAMVNSSWTKQHIQGLWWGWGTAHGKAAGPFRVYPPCSTGELASLPLAPRGKPRAPLLISVGQFRPEKAHALQIRCASRVAFAIACCTPQWWVPFCPLHLHC